MICEAAPCLSREARHFDERCGPVGFEYWTAEVSYRMCAHIHSYPAASTVVSIPDETRSKEAERSPEAEVALPWC